MQKSSTLFPKVTVGIPVYNQESFITETLKSVLVQDYENLEIIVSDDCSSDCTQEIINKLLQDYDFVYSRNKTNLGMVANYRHLLYNLANGDWYLNLDGDDLLAHKSVISYMVNEIKKYGNNNIVLFTGKMSILKKSKKTHFKTPKSTYISGKDYFEKISHKRHLTHASSLYNRKKALNLNFYSYQSLNTDFNSIIKLCFAGNIIFSNYTIAMWREHDKNQTKKIGLDKNSPEVIAYSLVRDYARNYISFKKAKRWYNLQMLRTEWYRVSLLLEKSGLTKALYSHLKSEERLTLLSKPKIIIKLTIKSVLRLIK